MRQHREGEQLEKWARDHHDWLRVIGIIGNRSQASADDVDFLSGYCIEHNLSPERLRDLAKAIERIGDLQATLNERPQREKAARELREAHRALRQRYDDELHASEMAAHNAASAVTDCINAAPNLREFERRFPELFDDQHCLLNPESQPLADPVGETERLVFERYQQLLQSGIGGAHDAYIHVLRTYPPVVAAALRALDMPGQVAMERFETAAQERLPFIGALTRV